MAKTLVILNPLSGHGAGETLAAEVHAALRRGGLDYDLVRTPAPHAAVGIADQARQSGYETIVAMGGDGTLHEVANGLLRAEREDPGGTLGMIPVGTGNDYIKMFGTPEWQDGVRQILRGNTRQVDVGMLTVDSSAPAGSSPHYFLNSCTTGFGAEAARAVHSVPHLTGMPKYFVAVLKTLVRYSVPRVRITLPDRVIEQRSAMIAAANGRRVGGGFLIAPTASVEDGMLDIIIADGLGRLGILSLLPRVMRGTHLRDRRVQFRRASHLVIESPDPLTVETDGEIPFLGAHRLEIDLLPQQLRILA